jgi:hypothetical protein
MNRRTYRVPVEAKSGYNGRISGSTIKEEYHYKRVKILLNPDHDALGSFGDPLKNPGNDPELVNGTRFRLGSDPTELIWQDGRLVRDKK